MAWARVLRTAAGAGGSRLALALGVLAHGGAVRAENAAALTPLQASSRPSTNELGRYDAHGPHWVLEAAASKAYLSLGLGGQLDFDRDGRFDLVLSTPRLPARRSEVGKVWALTPNFVSGDLTVRWSWMPTPPTPQRAGTTLAAGDFNGDGFTDLVVGIPRAHLEAGQVLLFAGGTNYLSPQPVWKLRGARTGHHLGASLLAADVNQDGLADLIAGETEWRNSGRVSVFLGTPEGLPSAPDYSYVGGGSSNEKFGETVAVLDANGDGALDLAVGAPNRPGPAGRLCGEVRLFLGTNGAFAETPSWIKTGETPTLGIGQTLASVGDLDRDGLDDLAVGGYGFNPQQEHGTEGELIIYRGLPTGLSDQPVWKRTGRERGELFGISVAGVGDINGDGWRDVVIGSAGDRTQAGPRIRGAVQLFLGTPQGLENEPSWLFCNAGPRSWTGKNVVALGDLNGDRLSDFGVFSPIFTPDGLEGSSGRFDVFFGQTNGYGRAEHFPWNPRACRRFDELVAEHLAVEDQAASQERAARRSRWLGWACVGLAFLLATLLVAGRWRRKSLAREIARRTAVEVRESFAHNLHDDLGGHVHAIRLLTERLHRLSDDSAEAEVCRAELLDTAQRLSGSMKRLLTSVEPEGDTLENLVTFLADYAPSILRPHGIACDLDLEPALPDLVLNDHARQHLFLAINELLNNIVKHSGAKHAWLKIRWASPNLSVELEDDGAGLNIPSSAPGTGNGMSFLIARSRSLGGSAEWHSRTPHGTRVTLRLPIEVMAHS